MGYTKEELLERIKEILDRPKEEVLAAMKIMEKELGNYYDYSWGPGDYRWAQILTAVAEYFTINGTGEGEEKPRGFINIEERDSTRVQDLKKRN